MNDSSNSDPEFENLAGLANDHIETLHNRGEKLYTNILNDMINESLSKSNDPQTANSNDKSHES